MRAAFITALLALCAIPASASAQDANLEAELGLINLNVGYRIGAFSELVFAGGPIYAPNTVGCPGYVPNAPHLSLDAAAGYVRIGAVANDQRDELTLIILGPGGWSCTDDRMGGGTQMIFEAARAGRYHVWVGSYEPNASIAAYVVADDEPEYVGYR